MKPRKHADLIKAWADGAEIETKYVGSRVHGRWEPFDGLWPQCEEDWEYRIKPEEKKPVVRWLWAMNDGTISFHLLTEEESKCDKWHTKLEWSRTEFPE